MYPRNSRSSLVAFTAAFCSVRSAPEAEQTSLRLIRLFYALGLWSVTRLGVRITSNCYGKFYVYVQFERISGTARGARMLLLMYSSFLNSAGNIRMPRDCRMPAGNCHSSIKFPIVTHGSPLWWCRVLYDADQGLLIVRLTCSAMMKRQGWHVKDFQLCQHHLSTF